VQQRAESPPELPSSQFLQASSSLQKWAEEVGKDWRGDSRIALDYYEGAEQWLEQAWTYTIWPFIQDCDFSCVVDLAAGHGRNSKKLLEVATKLYLVDINADNIRFCQQRFAGEKRITYIQNDGFTLNHIPSGEVTLVYCFDAMVHFDSDVVRSYLRDFHRVLSLGGYGFCHHSNYDRNPGGNLHDNPGWRNFMSQNLFLHYCKKEGFEIIKSQAIQWDTPELDCVTLFRKPL
jgi:SAM-dependent methyltransferase